MASAAAFQRDPEARILTYGYNADVVHFMQPSGQNTVREHARNLVNDLTNFRHWSSSLQRPLIFVAHSLGGLVCKQAFVLSSHTFEQERQLSHSLHGIMFLGTPHAGSDLSTLALTLGYIVKMSLVKRPNMSNLAVLEKDSEVLAGIQDSFSTAIRRREKLENKRLEIHCCIEEDPIKGIGHRVVEPDSAHFPGYHTSDNIPADHMSMTKFQYSSQVGYERLSGRLRRWVDAIRKGSAHFSREAISQSLPQQNAILVMPFAQDKDFVGREDVLTRLHEGFSHPTTLRRMALAGLGGIGKSQIAIEYAYRLRKKRPGTSVFWVAANSAARFEQSYRNIGTAARIPAMQDPKADVLHLVNQWLSSSESGDWLLILDNADDTDLFFRPLTPLATPAGTDAQSPCLSQYLPQTETGSILVTSRDEATAVRLTGGRRQVLPVDVMSEDDTLKLLTIKLDTEILDESANQELIVELDLVPLAITQASAYINVLARRMTVAKYLRQLRNGEPNQIKLLSSDEADLRRDPAVPNSVIRTWQITFSQIKDQKPQAADLLSCMCLLDRQAIPEFLLCQDKDTSLDFEEAIGTLLQFSLVMEEREEHVFAIHRLVQLATKKWIESTGKLDRFRENALELVYKQYPPGDYDNWTICEALEPHAQIVVDYSIGSTKGELQQSQILFMRALYALAQGKYKLSERMLHTSIDIRTRFRGTNDPRALDSFAALARTYSQQGRWKAQEELNTKVLEKRTRVLGAEHPDTLNTMADLALAYRYLGRGMEAAKLHAQVLDIKKRVLGNEHPGTLASISDFALLYHDQGMWTECEKMNIVVLETGKRFRGAEHPETLASMNNLAAVYQAQNKWKEAEDLHVQVLEIAGRLLGAEHPNTLNSMGNLAVTYRGQKKWKEAERLYLQVIEIRNRVLGAEHPHTLTAMKNLSYTYRCQNRHTEAIELMEKVVELTQKFLGPNHPDTINSVEILAICKDTQDSA